MKSLKANQIEKNRLSEKEMRHLTGGAGKRCGCGCMYASSGGASVNANTSANSGGGLVSAVVVKWVEIEVGELKTVE